MRERKRNETELSDLAREGHRLVLEAQKRLVDVVGRQMNTGVKTVGQDDGTAEAISISPGQ